jgi:hypothetical protein
MQCFTDVCPKPLRQKIPLFNTIHFIVSQFLYKWWSLGSYEKNHSRYGKCVHAYLGYKCNLWITSICFYSLILHQPTDTPLKFLMLIIPLNLVYKLN